MRTWNLSEAQDRFVEILRSCVREPQIVYDHNKPVGVVIDIALFKELMELRNRQHRPTIAELLDELNQIQAHETVEIEIPARQDRPNPIIEETNEVSM